MRLFSLSVTLFILLPFLVFGQQLAPYYTFSQASGSYSTISGTTVASGTGLNDQRYLVTLPFTYNVNGTDYTQCYISVNGYLAFDSDPGSNQYWIIQSTSSGFAAVAGFAADLASLNSGTELSYQTIGSAPNRTFVVQWKDFGYPSSTALTANFQIRLNETSNTFNTVYGNTTITGASNQLSVQVGVRGTSNAYYYNRGGSWSASSVGTSNSSNFLSTSSNVPSSGLTYTFSPPVCPVPTNHPTSLVLTPGFTVMNGSFTAASPAVSKYLIVRTQGAALNTSPVDGTTYAVNGSLGNGTIIQNSNSTSFSDNSLTMNTSYTYTIFPYNQGTCMVTPVYKITSPLTATATTYRPHAYTWQPTSGSADWTVAGNWSPARMAAHSLDTMIFDNGGTVTASNINTSTVSILTIANNTKVTLNSAGTNTLTISDSTRVDAGSSLTLGPKLLTLKLNSSTKPQVLNGLLTLTGKSTFQASPGSTIINADISLQDTSTFLCTTGGSVTINDTLEMKGRSVYNATGASVVFSSPVNLVDSSVFKSTLSMGTSVTFSPTAVVNIKDSSTYASANTGTTINSVVNVYGPRGAVSGSGLTFAAGTVYNHMRNGGSAPTANYHSTSTINMLGIIDQAVGFGGKLGNLVWNCVGQTANITATGTLDTIQGNFTIVNTGGYGIKLTGTNQAVRGNFTQQTGTLFLTPTNKLVTLGNAVLAAGTLDLNNSTSSGTTFYAYGNIAQSPAHSITKTGTGTAGMYFGGNTMQSINIGGTFNAALMSYTLNNNAGASLSGNLPVGSNSINTINAGAWSGTGKFVYDTTASLEYVNITSNHTTTDVAWPSTNGPASLKLQHNGTYPNNRLILHNNRSLTKKLTLTKGVFDIAASNLTLHSSTIADLVLTSPDSTKMIACSSGYFVRKVTAGSSGVNYIYPVGDNSGVAEYSPVNLLVAPNTAERYIGVSVKDARHPNNATTSNTVDRYWSFVDSGTVALRYKLDLYYPYPDNVPAMGKALQRWNGAAWASIPSSVAWVSSAKAYKLSNTDTLTTATDSLQGMAFTALQSAGNAYSWTGAFDNDFQNAGNWTPNRLVPSAADTLQFNTGIEDTVANIPRQTIRRLVFTNNTVIHLQAANDPNFTELLLTVASDGNATSKELVVDNGSAVYFDGTIEPLTVKFTGDSCTANVAGRIELINNGKVQSIAMDCIGCLAIVTPSGVLAAGGTGYAPFISGDSTSYLIQGRYEHKYASINGQIVNGKWATGSWLVFKGFTTDTVSPYVTPGTISSYSNYTVSNIEFDCPNMTAHAKWITSPFRARDTFKVISTGTGSLAWRNYFYVNHYRQTGGIVKLGYHNGSYAETGYMYLNGSLIQSGGAFTGVNGNLVFQGTSQQYVSFKDAAPSGPIQYYVENAAGINLVGTGALTTNFDIEGGVALAVPVANPFSTSLKFRYIGEAGLGYFGKYNNTIDSFLFPTVDGPKHLRVTIGDGNTLAMPFSRNLKTLYLQDGTLDIGPNDIVVGTSVAAPGSLSYDDGSVSMTTGSVTRWVDANGDYNYWDYGGKTYFPISDNGSNRHVGISFNPGTSLAAGGTITIRYRYTPGETNVSVTDGTYLLNKRTNAYWTITTGNGLATNGGQTMGMRLSCGGLVYPDTVASLRVMKKNSVDGIHANGSKQIGSPDIYVYRTGLTQVSANDTFYVGSNAANVPHMFVSVKDGKFHDPTTWDVGLVPGINDSVLVNSGDTVTVDSSSFTAAVYLDVWGTLQVKDSTLRVGNYVRNVGGTVVMNGGKLVLGPQGGGKQTFYNEGSMIVSSGLLEVNGNLVLISDGSRCYFEQTGGDIVVDGNAGGIVANSVPVGTPLVIFQHDRNDSKVTGGNMIIVDPHAGSNSGTCKAFQFADSQDPEFGTGHKLIFGDGVSTTSGGHSKGFVIGTYDQTTNDMSDKKLGSVIVKGSPSGNNRGLTHTNKDLCVGGNLTLQGVNATYTNAPILMIGGDITVDSGATFYTTGSLSFATDALFNLPNTTAQHVTGKGKFYYDSTSNFYYIGINNRSAAGVSFDIGDINVGSVTAGGVGFAEGKLVMKNNSTLTVRQGLGTYNGLGWVVGKMARRLGITNNAQTVIFPIGDSLTYAPLTFAIPAVTSEGHLRAQLVSSDHPNIATSKINPARSINKYHVVDIIGAFKATNISLSAGWVAASEDAGVNWANCIVSAYRNNTWTNFIPDFPATRTARIATFDQNNLAASYQVGEPGAGPTITQQPDSVNACAGMNVNFSVVAALAVSYQWQLNTGSIWTNLSNDVVYAGTNTNQLNVAGVTPAMEGYQYRCRVYNSYDSTTSAGAVLHVGTSVTPSVSIVSNSGASVCSGVPSTITATAVNGGTTPSFVWKRNGVVVGTNSSQYIDATLTNGDVIICQLTSSLACASTSPVADTLTMNVIQSTYPTVTVSVAPNDTICDGQTAVFTATPANAGSNPVYQWKVNGVNINANTSTYSVNNLLSGTKVSCFVTSNNQCAQPETVSDTVTLTVLPTNGPNITIVASPGTTVCANDWLTLEAENAGGGAPLTYVWRKNNLIQQTGTSNTHNTTFFSTGDVFTVLATSGNMCAIPQTSSDTVVITEIFPVTPSVSISANTGNTICTGTSVTFTATPSQGGSAPSYQWKKNNVNVGTNSSIYTNSSLANGDVIKCVITANNQCQTTSTATSNSITMTVGTTAPATISISANPGSTICGGASVTFTASITNGGSAPAYQWKVNGSNTGINSSTFTTTTLNNGDVVTCQLTSNLPCATPASVTSSGITMTVNPAVSSSVSIAANPGNTICAGAGVTFTATPTNGGSPSYQWKVNGSNVGSNSSTYSNSTLANGNVVTCVMSSSLGCTSPATSNTITMTVNPEQTPSVSVSSGSGSTICSGTSVTFTATPTNGGSSPSYQWKINGLNTGTNSTIFSTTSLTNNDIVTCVLTSNATCASPTTATSSGISMTVNTTVTPSVTVSANPGNTICSGASVTFTATPTNGGASPSYQWKVNGMNVGTSSTTYTSTGLANNDVVTCTMTSNATCPSPASVTSTGITMMVNPVLTPSVAVSASPGSTICSGTSVTFTATPTNGGSTPAYQWKLNNVNVGTNSSTYANSGLSNNDVIACVLTSNAGCLSATTATSTGVAMTVNANLTPSVSISANPGNTICSGASVTFTATPTNGGSSPSYQWKVNSVNAGTNSSTFNTTTLANNDIVTCELTSSATCLTSSTATSSGITMTVNATVTPAISISASPGTTICAGTSVTFAASPTNGGSSPAYQWKKNGVNVGTNNTAYTTTSLANGDVVTCELTSNATCASLAAVTSSGITMTVNSLLIPSVSVTANPGTTVCDGTNVTFTATPANGGSSPSYQWKVNGVNAGTNSATFSSSSLANGSSITCVLTSNATCLSTTSATSTTVVMTINPLVKPTVVISAAPGVNVGPYTPVTFTATVTNGGATPAFQWRKNGVNIPLATSNTYLAVTEKDIKTGDKITVRLTSTANCAAPVDTLSNEFAVNVNVGIKEVGTKNKIELFPNPNDGMFRIKGELLQYTSRSVRVDVISSVGQIVYSMDLPLHQNRFDVQVRLPESIAKGWYILKVEDEQVPFVVQ